MSIPAINTKAMNNFELAKEYFLDGCASLGARDFLRAEYKFTKSLELIPDRVSTLINLSLAQLKLKKYSEAQVTAQKVILMEADNYEAYLNLGLIENELKSYGAAVKFFDKAISLSPNNYEILSNKGNTLNELKLYDEAITHFDKVLSLKPDYAEGWSNKGNTLNELKRYDEAITHYDKALSLKPDYAECWSNIGNALYKLKRYDEAITHYDKALSLKPDYAEGWSNKGNVFNELKRYDEAISHYDKALSLKPDYAEGWSNKGNLFNELKRYHEAITCYEKAVSLKSDIDWLSGDLLHAKMKICSWSDFSESLENISKKVVVNVKVMVPFPLLSLNDDALLHKKCSEMFVKSKYPFNPVLGPLFSNSGNQKIRVGYFSADFRNHAVSLLTAELYELHDKNKFDIFAFSFGLDDKSPMRLRLSQSFNQFIDVSKMLDSEIAELSRTLQIDIAVDLGGHTQDSRTGIFSYRAAPIQTSYIGYLGTMGAEYYDYLLADKSIIPDELQNFYSEKIVYLPSYQANDRKRTISERQYTREELGLPDTGFVFCCFNNNYKILPSTFDTWMRILNAVEGSVLFLYADNEWAKANLIDEASLRGIDSARLVFGGRIPTEDYLARYRVCNLFLDTFPYNAGTTASDALWAGLPVLTLTGQSFASRVAASLLNAIGLPELITSTQKEYEALAIELALNPKKLADIKLKLENNRLTTPLFDTPMFTKNLEAAYIKMVERYQAGLEPEHILV
jgi:predicted O-linked N-acetylglucosamine transferase (SPINDLY family)